MAPARGSGVGLGAGGPKRALALGLVTTEDEHMSDSSTVTEPTRYNVSLFLADFILLSRIAVLDFTIRLERLNDQVGQAAEWRRRRARV